MAAQVSCSWSDITKKNVSSPEPKSQIMQMPKQIAESSFKSSEGISVMVVDTSAVIDGGEKLMRCAEKFVSVKEVIDEIKDPVSRHRMAFMPFTIQTMEPTEEALKQVISFSRATGDLQSLSDVDLKLLALTYTLEAQVHGTAHLRTKPPPLHVVRVRRLPEKDLPGWGNNVSNVEEWEELERATTGNVSNFNAKSTQSRILELKNLELDLPVASGDGHSESLVALEEVSTSAADDEAKFSIVGQLESKAESGAEPQSKPTKQKSQTHEVKNDGKLMVAEGIDASKGESKENIEDWQPAVSRSTRRRYLKRQARKAHSQLSAQPDSGAEDKLEEETPSEVPTEISLLVTKASKEDVRGDSPEDDSKVRNISSNDENDTNKDGICKNSGYCSVTDFINGVANINIKDEQSPEARIILQEQQNSDTVSADEACNFLLDEGGSEDENLEHQVGDLDNEEDETCSGNQMESASLDDGSAGSHQLDDSSSEQSGILRPFSNSSIACATNDFAMQNVILQMGLRLLTPNGIQVHKLHRWVLKCHACNGVTADVGRIFCPKCGNGGTLRKISVTVDENGIVQAGRQPRISIRGTRYSLPMPKGGREAITKNPILREDQLARKLLYPKTKKSSSNQSIDMVSTGEISFQVKDKRAPLQAPIRESVAVFTGRRNPNDNHFSRRKH